MSDEIVSGGKELKQGRSVGKSSGAKDAKSLKNNANRDIQAADMPDLVKEKEIARRIGGRGHGAHSPKMVERVLRLAELGYSPSQMAKVCSRVPNATTIYRWMNEDPDFNQAYKARYRNYSDDQMRQVLPVVSGWREDAQRLRKLIGTARKLPKVKELKPFEQVQAGDRSIQRQAELTSAAVLAEEKFAHRTLQVVARVDPLNWSERAEGESTTIIIDVGRDGPTKTLNLPGSADGQNVKALTAGKWERKALPAPERDAVGGARLHPEE